MMSSRLTRLTGITAGTLLSGGLLLGGAAPAFADTNTATVNATTTPRATPRRSIRPLPLDQQHANRLRVARQHQHQRRRRERFEDQAIEQVLDQGQATATTKRRGRRKGGK